MYAMDTDEHFIAPQPWSGMLEYERDEIVRMILQKFDNVIFARDDLRLEERDETYTCAADSNSMHTLLIRGHVGYARREAFLHLIRSLRLRSLADTHSSVLFACRKGDAVPHLPMQMLLPWESCRTCKAVRRWRMACLGVRCGLLQQVTHNRQLVRQRVAMHLRRCISPVDAIAGRRDDKAVAAAEEEASDPATPSHSDIEPVIRVDSTGVSFPDANAQLFFSLQPARKVLAHEGQDQQSSLNKKGVTAVRGYTTELLTTSLASSTGQSSDNITGLRKTDENEGSSEIDWYSSRMITHAPYKNDWIGWLAAHQEKEKEDTIDLVHLCASMPTMFVAWSYQDTDCMQWLRRHIFSDSALRKARGHSDLVATFAALIGVDSWLSLVEHYMALPEPRRPPKRLARYLKVAAAAAAGITSDTVNKTDHDSDNSIDDRSGTHEGIMPASSAPAKLRSLAYKRAQIVLVSVDRDSHAAREAYTGLLAHCKGWRSAFVDLIALWAGSDGLGSDYATVFDVHELPHIMTSAPVSRHTETNAVQSPHLTYIPYRPGNVHKNSNSKDHEAKERYVGTDPRVSDVTAEETVATQRRSEQFVQSGVANTTKDAKATSLTSDQTMQPPPYCRCVQDDDKHWHRLPKEQRAALINAVRSFITHGAGAPLRWSACIRRVFTLVHTHAAHNDRDKQKSNRSRQDVHVCVTSTVSMRGWMTICDAARAAHLMRSLRQVSNFIFAGQIILPSDGLVTELGTVTPAHRALGLTRVLTCSRCRGNIHSDVTAYYRCLHCVQRRGVFCVSCVRNSDRLCTDVSNHILLRIPAGATENAIPLLWGPGNVVPLPSHKVRYDNGEHEHSMAHGDAYCNVCQTIICNVRWKCAVCYEYDLCNKCFCKTVLSAEEQSKNMNQHISQHSHPKYHHQLPRQQQQQQQCYERGLHEEGTESGACTVEDTPMDVDVSAHSRAPVHMPYHPLLRITSILGTGVNGFLRPCVVDGLDAAIAKDMSAEMTQTA